MSLKLGIIIARIEVPVATRRLNSMQHLSSRKQELGAQWRFFSLEVVKSFRPLIFFFVKNFVLLIFLRATPPFRILGTASGAGLQYVSNTLRNYALLMLRSFLTTFRPLYFYKLSALHLTHTRADFA